MRVEKSLPPPDIAHLRGMGLKAILVSCIVTTCQHNASIEFDVLPFPDATPFPYIAESGRLKCGRCGSRAVTTMPDWRDYRAKGGGTAF